MPSKIPSVSLGFKAKCLSCTVLMILPSSPFIFRQLGAIHGLCVSKKLPRRTPEPLPSPLLQKLPPSPSPQLTPSATTVRLTPSTRASPLPSEKHWKPQQLSQQGYYSGTPTTQHPPKGLQQHPQPGSRSLIGALGTQDKSLHSSDLHPLQAASRESSPPSFKFPRKQRHGRIPLPFTCRSFLLCGECRCSARRRPRLCGPFSGYTSPAPRLRRKPLSQSLPSAGAAPVPLLKQKIEIKGWEINMTKVIN